MESGSKLTENAGAPDGRRHVRLAFSPHVLTLTPFYPSRGDEVRGCFVAESVKALEDSGTRTSVIGVQPFYRVKMRASVHAPAADWERFFVLPGNIGLPSAGRFLAASLFPRVRALHRDQPLDLIHAHAALPCGHAAALLGQELGIPFVVTVHGLDVFFDNQVRGILGKWCRRVSKWVYQSSAKTICISEKVREALLKGVQVDAALVYNGVDPEMFSPASDVGPDASILCVGNLIPIKGQDMLLRAVAAIKHNFPKLECKLVGEGPQRRSLESLARTLGVDNCVTFTGKKDRAEVAAAMAQCTVFALPSRYEGLGCVYLEAMASGKPVIACRGQGIEEILEHARNGWLIEPGNLPALVESLSTLLGNADLRSRIGEAARQTVLHRFTLAHQAERLNQIYCEHLA